MCERPTAGRKIPGVDGSDARKGDDPLRADKVHRLHTEPDGTRLYITSSLLIGSKFSASLISSSTDKKETDSAYALFAVALMMAAATEPEAKSK